MAAFSPTRLACADQAVFRHDEVHPDVVIFGGDGIDDLRFAADADGQGIRSAAGKQPVVVAPAATESQASGPEGDPGAQEHAYGIGRDCGKRGGGFPDAEAPRRKLRTVSDPV